MRHVFSRTRHGDPCQQGVTRTTGVTLFVVASLLGELENNMNIVRNVLAFVMLACLSLSAQQITGNIRGTVTDPSGAVIQGAAVTARQAETGLSRSDDHRSQR